MCVLVHFERSRFCAYDGIDFCTEYLLDGQTAVTFVSTDKTDTLPPLDKKFTTSSEALAEYADFLFL